MHIFYFDTFNIFITFASQIFNLNLNTMNGFDFYRIKTEWTSERDGGELSKVKTEELVYASSYTDAESTAIDIAENQQRSKFGSINYEIVKTKINELVYTPVLKQEPDLTNGLICNYFEEGEDTGVGLYCVRVMFIEVDEKTGKEKRSNENIYIPASSINHATELVRQYLKKIGEVRDFIVRDTKFDKTSAIFWPVNVHQEKVKLAEI